MLSKEQISEDKPEIIQINFKVPCHKQQMLITFANVSLIFNMDKIMHRKER
jgi:hypothetical protein